MTSSGSARRSGLTRQSDQSIWKGRIRMIAVSVAKS
jgi:hypothetical protein